MISFNVPPCTGSELSYIETAIKKQKISGDGDFTKKCSSWMESTFNCKKVLLTTSGTAALEMAALLCDLKEGDEVIMPSYTFSSTANAFVQQGATIVFIDVNPTTMNIDETLIEKAITNRTKVIVPVHYAGVSCEMDTIMQIAEKYKLYVVEDAAQGVMSTYKGKYLGTIGHFGCFSFHETKNYSMGEGGALLINDEKYIEQAEIIREKGTNRSKFYRGQIDKYTWVDYGSSYLPSELNAAYLWPQLEMAEEINQFRINIWNKYFIGLKCLDNLIELPYVPAECNHNAHMFYLKLKDLKQRTDFINFLKSKGIGSVFHYIPLHSSPAGRKFGRFQGGDTFTTAESERLVRLPLWYGLSDELIDYIIDTVILFFKERNV